MVSVQNNDGGWFIDYGMEDEAQATDFIWASQIVDDPNVRSMVPGLDASRKEGSNNDGSSSRKRNRTESCADPVTKAGREKMRRDRLNERFFELASILDPGRPLTPDKVAILIDATRRLNHLRLEVQTLQESNASLHESIKNIKVEKVELRDEKVKLKAEKERMEQILKSMSTPSPFLAHPAAATAYHPATFASFSKTVPYPKCPPAAMWQWIPPAILDTSQDHMLRPPVA